MIIFTKIHEDWTKNADILLMATFHFVSPFFDSDFTYSGVPNKRAVLISELDGQRLDIL